MLVDEHLRHADERLRLLPKEAGRDDQLFELRRLRLHQRARIGVALEQRRRHQVHPRIGRLRRQHRRRQQLERRPVVELGVGVRMLRRQRVDDAPGDGGRLQWTGPFVQPTFEYESE